MKMNSSEIRQAFINYFVERGHQAVASSTLVPADDPTLLFTNAGMVPFKNVFLGIESRPYQRAVSAQRCVRAGGKHNDLDNVGYTARHHTFFEMLGNFSFGDYFKREAIAYAWEFLTDVLKLPPERLWVTVYQDDDEAADIWLKEVGVSPERFSRCGEADNFWSMGDTGPCGPCTEIFYDHGAEIAGGPPGTADADGDRYIEIWNLVFMQYNRDSSGKLHSLPKPSVDTGMGLERITAVVQHVHNNYHIDTFQHLIQWLVTQVPGVDREHPSLKVIADHIRACAFLIADGVVPSNEGRGYVLRRIIRRAVRHGSKLGFVSPFFYQLITPLIEVMGSTYPEIADQKTQIEQILLQEENQFSRTLEHGLQLLREQIQTVQGQKISGEIAFKLYDTYGFPIDLTEDIAREHQLQVDMAGFDACMQLQRAQSQSANQFQVDYSHTDQLAGICSDFQGYEHEMTQSQIVAILEEGVKQEKLSSRQLASIVLNHTPFYAESGGQVGDCGLIISKQAVFQVQDTQRIGQAIVHTGHLTQGTLSLGELVTAQVDTVRRNAIRLNHTATHLLHAALKQVLGAHVQQKGSLVDAERARFDFLHSTAVTSEQRDQIERLVNQKIRENDAVVTELMEIEQAKRAGAVALFGEKYQDSVRVLSMGSFSKELCGGTHARRTGDIGLFKIISEYGVASGIRRIEMVTGSYALAWINQALTTLTHVSSELKATPEQVREKLAQVLQASREQEKELKKLQHQLAAQSGSELLADITVIGNVNLLVKRLEGVETSALRQVLDQLKSQMDNAVIVLFTVEQQKINVVAGVSKPLLGNVPSAAELVRHLCGKGGGRDDMAQGGGVVPDDLDQKISAIATKIAGYKK